MTRDQVDAVEAAAQHLGTPMLAALLECLPRLQDFFRRRMPPGPVQARGFRLMWLTCCRPSLQPSASTLDAWRICLQRAGLLTCHRLDPAEHRAISHIDLPQVRAFCDADGQWAARRAARQAGAVPAPPKVVILPPARMTNFQNAQKLPITVQKTHSSPGGMPMKILQADLENLGSIFRGDLAAAAPPPCPPPPAPRPAACWVEGPPDPPGQVSDSLPSADPPSSAPSSPAALCRTLAAEAGRGTRMPGDNDRARAACGWTWEAFVRPVLGGAGLAALGGDPGQRDDLIAEIGRRAEKFWPELAPAPPPPRPPPPPPPAAPPSAAVREELRAAVWAARAAHLPGHVVPVDLFVAAGAGPELIALAMRQTARCLRLGTLRKPHMAGFHALGVLQNWVSGSRPPGV